MTVMVCVVCDEDGELDVFQRLAMHEGCTPKAWVKDEDDRRDFMARVDVWWAQASPWQRNWQGRRK